MGKFKAELYKNRYEYCADLKNEWLSDIKYVHDNINTFTLTIPREVGNIINPIYDLIISGMQVVVTNIDGTQGRYFVKSKKGSYNKKTNSKQFTCSEFQTTLKGKRISLVEGNYYLLTNEGEEGLLDIIAKESGWSIGEVAEDVLKCEDYVDETIETECYLPNISLVQIGTLLFDLNVVITSAENKYGKSAITLSIEYPNVSTDMLDFGTVYNVFETPLHKDVSNIKGYYYSEAGERYCIKYIFTNTDGSQDIYIKNFVNVLDKNLIWNSMKITYTNGNKNLEYKYQYPLMSATDDNIYKLLEDMETVYNCVFVYDTMNKVINCYNKKTYGTLKGLELNISTNIIEMSDQEEESIPTGVKVIGMTVGDTQVDISSENPFGGDTIYNYDYYINNGLLSDSCVASWYKYCEVMATRTVTWEEHKDNFVQVSSALLSVESEIYSLEQKIKYDEDIKAVYINNNDVENTNRIQKEINDYKSQLTLAMAEKTRLKAEKNTINSYLQQYAVTNTMENICDDDGNKIFSKEDLEILQDVGEVIVETDEMYSTPYTCYMHYKEYLEEKITPTREFSVSKQCMTDYMRINDSIIDLGAIYEISQSSQEILGIESIRLVGYSYNPTEDTISSLTFSNKDREHKLDSKFANNVRKVKQLSTQMNQYAAMLSETQSTNEFVNGIKENGIDLNEIAIYGSGEDSSIEITNSGVYLKSGDLQQVHFGVSTMAVTNSGWEDDCSIISDTSGTIAESVVGALALGEKINIETEDGSFYIGKVDDAIIGLTLGTEEVKKIVLANIYDDEGNYDSVFEIYNELGEKVISNLGMVQTFKFTDWGNLDTTHPFESYFYLDDKFSRLDSATLRLVMKKYSSNIKIGNTDIKATTTESGVLYTNETEEYNQFYEVEIGEAGEHNHNVLTTTSESATLITDNIFYGEYKDIDGNKILLPVETKSPEALEEDEPIESILYNDIVTSSNGVHTHTGSVKTTIKAHNHMVESHNHEIDINLDDIVEYGITEVNGTSFVDIYVNDFIVATKCTTDDEINIKDYLVTDGWNVIKFVCNGMTKVLCDLTITGFVKF